MGDQDCGARGLADWANRERVTVYHSTPTVFRSLVGVLGHQRFQTVRLVVLGGEAVYRPDVEAFRKTVQQAYLNSDYAKVWPKGLLERINQVR